MEDSTTPEQTSPVTVVLLLVFPVLQINQLLCREGYAVGHDPKKKAPLWVAYRITSESVSQKFENSYSFIEDDKIPAEQSVAFGLSEFRL